MSDTLRIAPPGTTPVRADGGQGRATGMSVRALRRSVARILTLEAGENGAPSRWVPVGAAFVVDAERGLLATCAHVVRAAGVDRDYRVALDFLAGLDRAPASDASYADVEDEERDALLRDARQPILAPSDATLRFARIEPHYWRERNDRPSDDQLPLEQLVPPDVAAGRATWPKRDTGDDIAILRILGPLPSDATEVLLGRSDGSHDHPFLTFGFPHGDDVAVYAGHGTVHQRTKVRRHGVRPTVVQLASTEVGPVEQGFSGAPVLDCTSGSGRVVGLITTHDNTAFNNGYTAHMTPTEALRAACPLLTASDRLPYRHLEAFRAEDADLFHGRTAIVNELADLLACGQRLLVVRGPSGGGKSSLLHAGLLPQISPGPNPNTPHARGNVSRIMHWNPRSIRPAQRRSCLAIARELTPDAADPDLLAAIHTWAQLSPQDTSEQGRHLLLVLDQFEEIFVAWDPAERRSFAQQLLHVLDTPPPQAPIAVALVLRSDFFGRFADDPDMSPLLVRAERAHTVVEVPRLSRDDVAAIVENPARHMGLRFETGLVDQIVADTLGARDTTANVTSTVLPLLELALTRLWEKQEDGLLTFATYEEMRGVQRALVTWADDEFAKLSPEQQDLGRRVMLELVHLSATPQTQPDTRRPRSLRQIVDALGTPEPEVRAVIERLAAHDLRLLVTDRPLPLINDAGTGSLPLAGDQGSEGEHDALQSMIVELIHDVLIRDWPRLRDALQTDHEFRRWRQETLDRAERWNKRALPFRAALGAPDSPVLQDPPTWAESLARFGRLAVPQRTRPDGGHLLRGDDLAVARDWLQRNQATPQALGPLARAFVEASLRADRRRTFWETAAVTSIAGLALLTSLAAVIIFVLFRTATDARQVALQQRDIAIQARNVASSRSVAIQAESLPAEQTDLALLLSMEAGRVANTVEARRSLPDILSRNQTQRLIGVIQVPEDPYSLSLSPNGEILASGDTSGGIELWDMAHRRLLSTLHSTVDVVGSRSVNVAFGPDSKALVSANQSGPLELWDTAHSRQIAHVWPNTDLPSFNAIAFSPNGKAIAVGDLYGNVGLWNVQKKRLTALYQQRTWINAVAFSPDGRFIASGANDGSVAVWDNAHNRIIGDSPYIFSRTAITAIAFDPDGSQLAIGGADGSIQLTDLVYTGSNQTIDIGHDELAGLPCCGTSLSASIGPVNDLAFNHDGTVLASAGADGTIRFWDTQNHKLLSPQISAHSGGVRSLVFSPDDRLLISAGGDHSIRLWDMTSKQQFYADLSGHVDGTNSIAFSPDSRVLASGGADHSVRLWNVEDRRPIGTVTGQFGLTNSATKVTFSPDQRTLAIGSRDGTIRLWDVEQRQYIDKPLLATPPSAVSSLTFSRDGAVLASSGEDQTISLWDVKRHRLAGVLRSGYRDIITSLAFSPKNDDVLASGSQGGTISLWDTVRRHVLGPPLTTHLGAILSVAFNPDGSILASGGADGIIHLSDTTDVHNVVPLQTLPLLQGHKGSVVSVAFSPDGHLLASGGADHTVRLWDMSTGRLHGTPLLGHYGTVTSVTFSPDGRTIASGSSDHTVRLWDIKTGRLTRPPLVDRAGSVESLAFSPDGNILASASSDNSVRLWERQQAAYLVATTGGIGRGTPRRSGVYATAISPSGEWLAAACADGGVRLWRASHGWKPIDVLRGAAHSAAATSIAFSPDSNSIAFGSSDGSIRVWDVIQRRMLVIIHVPHPNQVSGLAFSPDGMLLVSGDWDGDVSIWDTAHWRSQATKNGLEVFGGISSIAFSATGDAVALGSLRGSIYLWRAVKFDISRRRGPSALIELQGHTTVVTSVTFSRNGKLLASGSWDGTARLWNTANYHSTVLSSFGSHVDGVAFSPDSRILAAGYADHLVRLWNVANHRRWGGLLAGHTSYVQSVVFLPNGKSLISAGWDGTVRFWNIDGSSIAHPPFTQHPTLRLYPSASFLAPESCAKAVNAVAFSPDGKVLAAGCEEGGIRLWHWPTRQTFGAPLRVQARILGTASGPTDPIRRIMFSQNGGWLVFSTATGFVGRWPPIYWRLPQRHTAEGAREDLNCGTMFTYQGYLPQYDASDLLPTSDALDITTSGDGKKEAVSCRISGIEMIDTTNNASLDVMGQIGSAGFDITSIVFTPHSDSLVAGSSHGVIYIWSALSGRQQIEPIIAHSTPISRIVFDRRSNIFASGAGPVIRLWTLDGQPLETLSLGGGRQVTDMAFSPDGKTLAAASSDGGIRLWSLDIASWKRQACHIANRNLTVGEWRRYFGDLPYHATCPGLPVPGSRPNVATE